MRLCVFTIPAYSGEADMEQLNQFLDSHKVLDIQHEFYTDRSGQGYWSFLVRYLPKNQGSPNPTKPHAGKVDYRELLGEEVFQRYNQLRKARNAMAEELNVPAFVIFTNEMVAELAKLKELTPETMRTVKGIGEKKVSEYAEPFIQRLHENETQQTPF